MKARQRARPKTFLRLVLLMVLIAMLRELHLTKVLLVRILLFSLQEFQENQA